MGNTFGSAATTPADTGVPDAVTRPMQYAVAVKGNVRADDDGALGVTATGCVWLAHAVSVSASTNGK